MSDSDSEVRSDGTMGGGLKLGRAMSSRMMIAIGRWELAWTSCYKGGNWTA